jgi:glycosyltransferase involved in cell wall biosynthesis
MTGRKYLLDVSRMLWRRWSGRLPTGIDRVCLEYLEQFGLQSQAVVQFKGRVYVLTPADTDRLVQIIRSPSKGFRRQLIALAGAALFRGSRNPPRLGMLYLNVGHTGLDQSRLIDWIARTRVAAVYLIHDLIPITHPQFCRSGEAAKHRQRVHNALLSGAGIICNSEATRGELIEFARGSRLAMPPTIVAWISGPPSAATVVPRTLDRPYFVTLGTIEGRKNHILLLEIWRRFAATMGDEAPVLVIIGQRGWEAEAAIWMLDQAPELKNHVRELAHCDDNELAGWLGGARAMLMPSFVEGFGLPVVEALQLRVPVIASDLPVYHEVAGEIPTYLEPLDTSGWEKTIREFILDGPERSRQLDLMRSYQAPDWQSHFTAVDDWLNRAVPCLATPAQSA